MRGRERVVRRGRLGRTLEPRRRSTCARAARAGRRAPRTSRRRGRARRAPRAAVRLVRVVGDHRHARARAVERPRLRMCTGGTPAPRRRERRRTARGRREAGPGPRAGAPRSAGGPGETRPGRRTPPARPERRSRSAISTSASQARCSSAPGADDDGGALRRRRAARRARRPRRGPRRRRAGRSRRRRADRPRPAPGASQSSIGTMTSAGPHRVVAACHARPIAPGMSCGLTGCSTETGYVPASPSRRPARNGSWARWRRSC